MGRTRHPYTTTIEGRYRDHNITLLVSQRQLFSVLIGPDDSHCWCSHSGRRNCCLTALLRLHFARLARELGREHDGPVEGNRQTAVPAAQHDGADNQFRERAHRAGKRVVFLVLHEAVAAKKKGGGSKGSQAKKLGMGDGKWTQLMIRPARVRLCHRQRRFRRLPVRM